MIRRTLDTSTRTHLDTSANQIPSQSRPPTWVGSTRWCQPSVLARLPDLLSLSRVLLFLAISSIQCTGLGLPTSRDRVREELKREDKRGPNYSPSNAALLCAAADSKYRKVEHCVDAYLPVNLLRRSVMSQCRVVLFWLSHFFLSICPS